MSAHKAQQLADQAIGDLVAAAKAEGYEYGFKAGEGAAMKTLSMGDVAKGLTSEMKASLHEVLDKLALFRHMIATYDTRYSMLGEIIGEFAALLGEEGPSEATIVNETRADHMVVGDEYQYAPGDWQRVKEIAVSQAGRLHIRTDVGEHYFDHRDSVVVRRKARA